MGNVKGSRRDSSGKAPRAVECGYGSVDDWDGVPLSDSPSIDRVGRSWHDHGVSASEGPGLTRIEDELMVCAMEAWAILPYASHARRPTRTAIRSPIGMRLRRC